MPYQSTIEVRDDHVRVKVSGERVPGNVAADSGAVIRETITALESSKLDRCLLVLRLTGPLSALDAFDLVTASEEQGWKRNYRLALVNLNVESLEDTRFTEIVAGNRAYPVRVFADEDEALDWLL